MAPSSRRLAFRVLDLYCKVAIFELEQRKCTSGTGLVLQGCDVRAGGAKSELPSCHCSELLHEERHPCQRWQPAM